MRKDAIAGLEYSTKTETKVWDGVDWRADECPIVAMVADRFQNQKEVEAVAAISLSLPNQTILEAEEDSLEGEEGFSEILTWKLTDRGGLLDETSVESIVADAAKARARIIAKNQVREEYGSELEPKRIVVKFHNVNEMAMMDIAEAVTRGGSVQKAIEPSNVADGLVCYSGRSAQQRKQSALEAEKRFQAITNQTDFKRRLEDMKAIANASDKIVKSIAVRNGFNVVKRTSISTRNPTLCTNHVEAVTDCLASMGIGRSSAAVVRVLETNKNRVTANFSGCMKIYRVEEGET